MPKKYGIVILVLLTALGVSFFFYHRNSNSPQTVADTNSPVAVATLAAKLPENPCLKPNYETEQIEMKDSHMKGLIEVGDKYTVVKGWYKCNPVKRDDVVFYVYNYGQPAVPRLVHAIPGDKFKLVKDKKRKAWNLSVNGKLVTNGDGKEPHFFGNDAPPVLSLYENSMKGVLAPSTYIIFSTVSPGSFDSEMGVVNSEDFRGKVDMEKIHTGKVETSKEVDTRPASSKQIETEPE